MSDQIAGIAFIHALLFIAALGYAAFLDQEHIQKLYRPNYVELTVIGGDLLIWLAVIGLALLGVFPPLLPLYYITLHIVACIPIAKWQRRKRIKRKRNQEEINRRLEERH